LASVPPVNYRPASWRAEGGLPAGDDEDISEDVTWYAEAHDREQAEARRS